MRVYSEMMNVEMELVYADNVNESRHKRPIKHKITGETKIKDN